jgi:hypothetical protein
MNQPVPTDIRLCGHEWRNNDFTCVECLQEKTDDAKNELKEIRACDKCDLCEDHHL